MNGEAIRDIKEIFKGLPSFFKVVFIISWVFTIWPLPRWGVHPSLWGDRWQLAHRRGHHNGLRCADDGIHTGASGTNCKV